MHRPSMQLGKNCVIWYFCLHLSSDMVRYLFTLNDKDLIQGTWKSVGVFDRLSEMMLDGPAQKPQILLLCRESDRGML